MVVTMMDRSRGNAAVGSAPFRAPTDGARRPSRVETTSLACGRNLRAPTPRRRWREAPNSRKSVADLQWAGTPVRHNGRCPGVTGEDMARVTYIEHDGTEHRI